MNGNSIACFNFDNIYDKNDNNMICGFQKIDKKKNFRVNLQAGLWQKKYLLKFLRKHEGPWQLETWGNLRSRRFKGDIYHRLPESPAVFEYMTGGILADSRWHDNEALLKLKKWGFEEIIKNREIYSTGGERKTEISKRSVFRKTIDVLKSLI